MQEAAALGRRVREAAGLAGLSFGFWGQVERGEKAVTSRRTLEAMVSVLRVHPSELTGQPWTPRDACHVEAPAGLEGIEIALERYELGTDPGIPVRDWPRIAADLERLCTTMRWTGDYAAQSELAPALLGELHGAYVRLPDQRREVLLGLMNAYSSAMWTTKRLGAPGLPGLAARAVQQCAEILGDPVWLGYAVWLRGAATGHLDRAGHYRRSVAAAENLTSQLDGGDALQACGLLHLSAALAAGAQDDHEGAATHLAEASVLAARMTTEVGAWANLFFGLSTVGIWKTSIALELGEYGQVLEAAQTVHPDLLPSKTLQAGFWAEVAQALVTEKNTRDKAVPVLVRAEQLAPQRIHHDVLVREVVADLLRQARREAGGRELRGLAWRMGIAPLR